MFFSVFLVVFSSASLLRSVCAHVIPLDESVFERVGGGRCSLALDP